MSGGVDSSVAASLLIDQGHDVSGVTLRLWGGSSDSGCCSVEDVTDAALVAASLGIDHHVFNLTEEFQRYVVDPYVTDHLEGRTPNPCIECNRHLKFDELLVSARRLGFDALATGHHARIVRRGDVSSLVRGEDPAKDQSYVLSMLTQEQLGFLLLPVGELTKAEVRDYAHAHGLRTAGKAESQDVCFIQSRGGRSEFLTDRATLTPGEVVDAASGDVIGHVAAVELMTVGQKQGLGLDSAGRRRVVISSSPKAGTVVVTSDEEAQVDEIAFDETTLTWTEDPLAIGEEVMVQMRSHGAAIRARFEEGCLKLSDAVAPVAPGQTAAIYDATHPEVVRGSARVVA